MFTSRAEYRLLLREDNADLRLTEQGYKLGVVSEQRYVYFCRKREQIEAELQRLKTSWVQPQSAQAQALASYLDKPMSREHSQLDLLKRPQLNYQILQQHLPGFDPVLDPQVCEQVEIQAKYAGYIERQQEEIAKIKQQQNTPIPSDFDYDRVGGLSNEILQKLKDARPETIGQASRISGVTPAAISILLIYLKKKNWQQQQLANR